MRFRLMLIEESSTIPLYTMTLFSDDAHQCIKQSLIGLVLL